MKNIVLVVSCICFTQILAAQLNMSLLSNWDNSTVSYNDVWGYVDENGDEYAILGSKTHTYFIDLSIPSTPSLIASFDGSFTDGTTTISGANTTWRDFKTFKTYAYGVCDYCGEGLAIYDLSDIANGVVTKVKQDISVFTSAHNIYVDAPNGRLYAVGGTMGDKVAVFDVEANPEAPLLLANVSIPGGYLHDIFVQNNIAYGSSDFDGMYIIDFSTPTSPQLLEFLNTGGYNHSAWIYEDGTKLLYAEEVPQGLPLGILDISDLANNGIVLLNTFNDPLETVTNNSNVTYHNPYIVDNYVVVSSYNDGVTIFDISNPLDTNLVAYYDTYSTNVNTYNGYNGCWGTYPYLPSGIILSSDRSTGLHVLSTTIPLTTECANGVQDAFERGVDCGGFCKPCPTCEDGIQNGDEVGIDCGGTFCMPCSSCTDGIQNGTETGIDCGGTACLPCPTCTDGIKNGDEIGIDCGGSFCAACPCSAGANISGIEVDTTYHVKSRIVSTALVPANTDVSYRGYDIELRANFQVDLNANFLVIIDPCVLPIAPSITYGEVLDPPLSATAKEALLDTKTVFQVHCFRESNVLNLDVFVPQTVGQAYLLLKDSQGNGLKEIHLESGRQDLIKVDLAKLTLAKNEDLSIELYQDKNMETKTAKNN